LREEALVQLHFGKYPVVVVKTVFSRNAVYQTAYHVVGCPKYRRQILTGDIAQFLRGSVGEIWQIRKWRILALEVQPDHVPRFVSFPPAVSIAEAVKILKGSTARDWFTPFPEIGRRLRNGAWWSLSYYAGTAGQVCSETIGGYIERTEHIRGRR
jgi:putative transposase